MNSELDKAFEEKQLEWARKNLFHWCGTFSTPRFIRGQRMMLCPICHRRGITRLATTPNIFQFLEKCEKEARELYDKSLNFSDFVNKMREKGWA